VFIAGGCADRPHTILPGVLNLDPPERGRLENDCLTPGAFSASDYQIGCVVLPRESADDEIESYTQQLAELGYIVGGAAGSALWADREINTNCLRRLVVIADDYPSGARSSEVSLTFAVERRARCGSERAAPL
jgi:hypothetical protein